MTHFRKKKFYNYGSLVISDHEMDLSLNLNQDITFSEFSFDDT